MSAWRKLIHGEAIFSIKDCPALLQGQIYTIDKDQEELGCKYIPVDKVTTNLCIPLIAQEETLGVFYLITKIPTALSAAKQILAYTVADQVALALSNLRLHEILKQQSIRDSLTGLFNRRYLEEVFNQELLRAQRQQHAIGLIMLDIDHFKRFNDTYGHEVGDYVLKIVSALLQENIRRSDIACRYGGEEMILLLPDSSLEVTRIRAEEICVAIAQTTLFYNSQSLGNLTASLGVASFPLHGATSSAVIQAADAALYRAKAAGRNQVVVCLV